MAKVICTVCGREIDSRGLSGHMRTHKGKPKESDTDGVISYPSNEQETTIKQEAVPENDETSSNESKNRAKKTETVKKPVKKPVASKPASSPASSPDTRGQDKPYHKSREWQGLFRD